MTPRPITWTDEELKQASERGLSTNVAPSWLRSFLRILGALHPAESREREREAAAFGARLSRDKGEECYTVSCQMQDGIDARYPSLLAPSPPPLTLSTGRWVKADKKGWVRREDGELVNVDYGNQMPLGANRSDFTKIADWLQQFGSAEERT